MFTRRPATVWFYSHSDVRKPGGSKVTNTDSSGAAAQLCVLHKKNYKHKDIQPEINPKQQLLKDSGQKHKEWWTKQTKSHMSTYFLRGVN